jgi:TRAP transporter 4TM/12TM fusion protein
MDKNLSNSPTKKDNFLAIVRLILGISIPLIGVFFIVNIPLIFFRYSFFNQQYKVLFWSLTVALLFLTLPAKKGAPKNNPQWYDLIAAAVSLIVGIITFLIIPKVMLSIGLIQPIQVIFGILAFFLVLESVRRSTGISVVCVIIVFFVYAKWGYLIQGLLGAAPLSWSRMFQQILFGSEFLVGLPLGVGTGVVFGFIFFGAVFIKLGAADFLMDLAFAVMGKVRGGPAKVSVISSALFGTISGSAVANVIATGTITIPLMKKTGYPDYYAGAVEAVASTGGQIMPPVMGAAAFVMADYLGIPYAKVCIIAAIPAILYYLGIFTQVDSEAIKLHLGRVPKENIKPLKDTIKKGWMFIIPIFVLFYTLFIIYLSAPLSALCAVAVALIVSLFNIHTRRDFWTLRDMADLLQKISRQMFSIISLCGASGMVVGLIAYTGLGVSFSELLTEISGGSILNLALLVALASTILGMGMPTTPAYIMLVALAVPAMVSLGVLPITAHLFCFYFGTLSMITPPICLAVFAASTLSGAGHLPIAFQAIKLAIAAYLIPFIILYNPSLALIEGNIIQKLTVIAFTTIAVYLISISFEGYAIKNKLKIIERIVLTVIALVLIIPNPEIKSLSLLMMKIAGSILALFFIFSLTIKNKKLLKTQTV